MVVDQMRKMMEAVLGPLSPTKAQDLARSMMNGEGKEQISKTAADLLEWSRSNRERVSEIVRSEVRSQLKQLGLASRDEVEALRKRVRELEKGRALAAKTGTAKPAATRSAPRKRSSVKQPGTRADATATA